MHDAYFERCAYLISENETIRSIRKGLLHMMPLVLIGSFVLMLLNLPIPPFQRFMESLLGDSWRTVGLSIYTGTFQILSLTALLSVSYALATEKANVRSGELNAISVMLTCFASYVVFHWEEGVVISTASAGSASMFAAIVIAVLGTNLFVSLEGHHRLRLQAWAFDSDSLLLSSLRTLTPSMLTVLAFALLRFLIDYSGLGNWLTGLYASLSDAFGRSGGSLPVAIVFVLVVHLLWFFGLHGTNMLDGPARDLFVTASEANATLVASGAAPTNILTKEFFDAFVFMGGCGCTLGLIVALLFASKSSNINRLGRYSLLPGLFNINEMMVYGLPLIFNPYYLVPFLFTPVMLCVTTWLAMYLGLVPLTSMRVEWTTPIFISGYVSTGSLSAVVLQAFNLAVSAVVYIPFIRLYEKNLQKKGNDIYKQLSSEVCYLETVQKRSLLQRADEVGVLGRHLSGQLEDAMERPGSGLHLQYQPKVDEQEQVFGAEALIRWNHPQLGFVSPLVILGIAEEAGLHLRLGRWVLDQAIQELQRWQQQGLHELRLSINLSPLQLLEDHDLVDHVRAALTRSGVAPADIELELTENAAIDQGESTRSKLDQLKALGVNIAIDDFGMGYSSILYLRDFYANVVKIDISLVRTITTDKHSQGIVASVVQLCHQLDIEMVAEGVETRAQMEALLALGCHQFQGFLFSRALPSEEFVSFVKKNNAADTAVVTTNGRERA